MLRAVISAAAVATVSALMVGNGTVYKTGSTYSVTIGVIDKAGAAYGSYTDLLFAPSAFGQLNIETNAAKDDVSQLYAAGFLEGVLTWERIHQQVDNIKRWIQSEFVNNTVPPAFQAWFEAQDKWTRSQIVANPADTYWQAVGSLMAQFDGMLAGYNSVAPAEMQLGVWDFQQLNGLGDLLDLIPVSVR